MADESRPTTELSDFHRALAHEYIRNGFNKTLAYHTIKPNVLWGTARAEACCILNRPIMKAYVRELMEQQNPVSDVTKGTLIKDASRVSKAAEKKEHFSAALKGIELQGRFIGAFDMEEDAQNQYMQVLQRITGKNVTVNIGQAQAAERTESEGEVIVDP